MYGVAKLLTEYVEGSVVAVGVRVILVGAAVRCDDDERLDVTVDDQVVHEGLDVGCVSCHAPFALVAADAVHQVEHVVLLGLVVVRREIDKCRFRVYRRVVGEIIVRLVLNRLDGAAVAKTVAGIVKGNGRVDLGVRADGGCRGACRLRCRGVGGSYSRSFRRRCDLGGCHGFGSGSRRVGLVVVLGFTSGADSCQQADCK